MYIIKVKLTYLHFFKYARGKWPQRLGSCCS